MISMAIIVATKGWEHWRRCVDSWNKTARDYHEIIPVRGMQVLEAYQLGYIQAEKHAEVIGFLHDDLVIFEQGWDKRVLKEFEDPAVGMVGFGGGLGHGRPELYRVPYHLPDLARPNFMSNMKQAEVHGERFKGVRDVAVLDGFAEGSYAPPLHELRALRRVRRNRRDMTTLWRRSARNGPKGPCPR